MFAENLRNYSEYKPKEPFFTEEANLPKSALENREAEIHKKEETPKDIKETLLDITPAQQARDFLLRKSILEEKGGKQFLHIDSLKELLTTEKGHKRMDRQGNSFGRISKRAFLEALESAVVIPLYANETILDAINKKRGLCNALFRPNSFEQTQDLATPKKGIDYLFDYWDFLPLNEGQNLNHTITLPSGESLTKTLLHKALLDFNLFLA